LLTPIFLYFLFHDGFTFKFISLIVFIIASLTDRYDGIIARKFGSVTKWGTFSDPLADKLLVSSALFAFSYLGYISLWIVIIIVVRDFLVTFLRIYAIQKQEPVITSQLARVKTFVQMVSIFVIFVFLLIEQLAINRGSEIVIITVLQKIYFINVLMLIVAFLTAYTGIQYFIENRNHVLSLFKSSDQNVSPSDS
jgi:CDP-diacylglycerol--glycerol-3-phosphate 3-phosphatidyltransferase